MILGAGIYQVPLIRTARRMGLYTIVVSIPGDYPGFALADKIYELNTRDRSDSCGGGKRTDRRNLYIGNRCGRQHNRLCL